MGSALDHIRHGHWLDGERVRGYALLLALAGLALLANSYIKAMGPDGTDFLAFWGAGHVASGGDPAAAYDLAVQERVQTATGSVGWFAFVNPPPFLLAAAPFGALPFPIAWLCWIAVTGALWAWAAIRAFPRLWLPILAFPGAVLAAGHAQTGFLTGALLIGGVILLDRRPLLAGALLGALIVKPHLALLVPFWLAAGGRWRAIAAAAASAAGLLLVSWAVFGTATMIAYTTSWQASAAIMRGEDADLYLRMATPYAMLHPWIGAGASLALGGALALGLIALTMRGWRRLGGDPLASGALMLAASALASPYLFNYDLPFLILPILWLAREGRRTGFLPWEKIALVLCYLAPLAARAAALPLSFNAMPLASLLLVWLIWRRGGVAGHGLAGSGR